MTSRVAFYIARFSRSGVPLAQVRLAKALARRGHSISFVVGFVPEGLTLPVVEGVGFQHLNEPRTVRMLPGVLRHVRAWKPDVIFTAEDHLNVIVTLAAMMAGSRARISASSRVTPFDTYSDQLFTKRWVLKHLSVLVRRRVDALVCVSEDMVKQYESIFGVGRFQCIYNVVCDADTERRMNEPINDPWIEDQSIPLVVSAGRLAPEKGLPDLIKAFRLVTAARPARLAILGEGPLRKDLESLVEREGLSELVRFVGFQENPLKFYKAARVFVLSSYVEGLPNVLVEAMACGCTPVSTDCPTGPREVLQGGRFGYLVPVRQPEAMATAIEKALDQPLSAALLREAIEPFTEERVIRRHEEVLGL